MLWSAHRPVKSGANALKSTAPTTSAATSWHACTNVPTTPLSSLQHRQQLCSSIFSLRHVSIKSGSSQNGHGGLGRHTSTLHAVMRSGFHRAGRQARPVPTGAVTTVYLMAATKGAVLAT